MYLVDDKGLDDDYSALFVTSTIRNAGLSVASQEAALGAINVLAGFCVAQQINLVSRFGAGSYLTSTETQALSDYAQQNFGSEFKKQQKVVALGKVRRGYAHLPPSVARQTHSKRLTHIASFVDWLAKYLLTHTNRERAQRITAMHDEILSRRLSAAPSRDDVDEQEFLRQDNELLNEVILPGSARNPFSDGLQLRNLLLVELLRQTGIRRGEALSLQVRDVDHIKRQITVRRRHDTKDDSRVDQPLVKTEGRVIPISPYLTDLIVQYVAVRRTVPGATKHRYLFVTHKSGLTHGQPMTKAALREVFGVIAKSDEGLSHLRPHQLRHFFSSELAHHQFEDGSDPDTKDQHRRVRNYIAGRKPHSEVDATYTKIETKRQARDVVLAVQEKLTARTSRSRSPT